MTNPNYGATEKLTVGQAVVRFIAAQYTVADGVKRRFIPAAMGIFGHGNVAGLGQALDQYNDILPFIQGRNEQGLTHAAIGFAKATNRTQTFAVTASIGPGALNMVTPAGLATVNHLPVLLLPGDSYTTRRQGPVLQQLEHPLGPDISVNDAFRPIAKFFDRITRPEQLLYSLPNAFRVLANPAETGAVVLALPQDVQSHAFDFPKEFFEERVWKIRRAIPDREDIGQVAKMIKDSKKIRFEGNGYGDEWVKEAEKRGLSNLKDTPRALQVWGNKKYHKLFNDLNVLTPRELEARQEIEFESYVYKIQIEARVMEDMIQNYIVPAAVAYQNKLIQNVQGLVSVLGDKAGKAASKSQISIIEQISEHLNKTMDLSAKMLNSRKKANNLKGHEEKAVAYCDTVRIFFDEIRYNVDKLELLIDDEEWRLPKFREMLFTR